MSKPGSNISRLARERILAELRRELMGPTSKDEAFKEFPTSRYLVGRLAPTKSTYEDYASDIDPSENDSLEAGSIGNTDSEDGIEEATPPLTLAFNPSSFGLSFLIDGNVSNIRILVSWGDYKKENDNEGNSIWHRYHREGAIDGINFKKPGNMPKVTLSPFASNPPGVIITGLDDLEITLEGVIHDFSGYRAVSLFLVNRRSEGPLGDRTKDERWIFQPKITITTEDKRPIFVAKDLHPEPLINDDDGEATVNELLYKHVQEFATGHGVAVGWDPPEKDSNHTTSIFTEFIPMHEVPLLIAPSEQTGSAVLNMKALAEVKNPAELVKMLEPMTDAYDAWIATKERESLVPSIQSNNNLRDAAKVNIECCKTCSKRMRASLDLLQQDSNVFKAFRFANYVMWDQRTHSLWAAANRKKGRLEGSANDFNKPENCTWRPFQMGFILLNLYGIAVEDSKDRRLVDLLWFPTGGGKTEAYLGLSAFVIGLRRLRGDKNGLYAGAGVSIIMRYTLRLLTVQQFQRAAALICACEIARKHDQSTWGDEAFRIGVWVGSGATPNTFDDSLKALEDLRDGKKPKGGSPVQLITCPRCGNALVSDKGIPEKGAYLSDKSTQRTIIFCKNNSCEFCAQESNNKGLPVVVVDDEIYRTCPSLVVATVDKFARIPFKGETRALFGLRNRYSPTYGHLTEAHGDKVGGRIVRDASPASSLLPPELIIQDELHLISGPLGTMVGLYETIVDYATARKDDDAHYVPAKVIASTATIRRASHQTNQLYARKLAIFPPAGLDARDSFFARELQINPEDDATAGRLYVGINAPGSSTKTLLVRVYSSLLAAGEAELRTDSRAADPYLTLVGYFNSLRALGGAKRLVEDDVRLVRLKYLSQQRGFPQRNVPSIEELTSRIDSWKIPALLKKLDNPFPRGQSDWPVDVLLATNMISVGVDIDRLGLMVVTGQPKTTSEYIQATSRVGRKYPGLVITMYNWVGARDLSHYERFKSYHAALYKYVEAISVTPFSSRSLDRGLRGIFAGMNRLFGEHMSIEPDAQSFDPTAQSTNDIIEAIYHRAVTLVGKANADLVRDRLLSYRDHWAILTDNILRYTWLNDSLRPPNNSRVLLKTAGTQNEGEWSTPGSLREVEPTAAFYLEEGDS